MEKKFFSRHLLLLLFFVIGVNTQSQQLVVNQYLSISESYKFKLSAFDISIPMPAGMGFKLPKISGKNIALEMNENVDYYFPMDMLKKDNVFKFSFNSTDESCMQMQIQPFDSEFDRVYLLEKVRYSSDYVETIASLVNVFGESVSYRFKNQGKSYDVHAFYHQNHLFTFLLASYLPDKAKYEKLIKNIKKENFYGERVRYENRVKSGYYDKKKTSPDIDPENELRDIKGKNKYDTRLVFPLQGLSLVMPKDYVYNIKARGLIDKGDGTTEVYRSQVDMFDNFFFTWYRGAQGYIMSRYISKKNKNARDFSDVSSGVKQVYGYYKDFDIIIDGIKAGATFYGQPDMGTVEIWFENEGGYFSFMLSEINNDNISFFDNFLASIKIESSSKRIKYDQKTPLSSVLKLEKTKVVKLEDFKIKEAIAADLSSFRCEFAKIGATLFLPGKPSQYKWGIDDSWGKNVFSLNDMGQTTLAPSYQDVYVSIRTGQPDYKVDCTLYLTYGAKYTVKDLLSNYVKVWNDIKDQKSYKEAGLFTAKDGSQWGVYIKNSETESIIFGCNDNYSIYLTFSASSAQKLKEMLTLLHKFKMKEQSLPVEE